MAKSKPIGVRFDLDMLEAMAEDKIADSPQKALNFLSAFWNERRDKINFSEKFADLNLKKAPIGQGEKVEQNDQPKPKSPIKEKRQEVPLSGYLAIRQQMKNGGK